MHDPLSDRVRDAGYEALCFAAGYLALSLHPTPRNQNKVHDWIHASTDRRQALRRLQRRGFLEIDDSRTGQVLKLTETGRRILAGGREPLEAWERPWDGVWRLLVFDLPKDAGRARTRFWRWLRARHFGNLQGSAWISPDPVPDLEETLRDGALDPKAVVIFSGTVDGKEDPRDLAARAWSFPEINEAYRHYIDFAARALRQLTRKPPTPSRRVELLREDRERWSAAIRSDPLLPRALHPSDYPGLRAWKSRTKLQEAFFKSAPGDGR